jgi:hypothetical protein
VKSIFSRQSETSCRTTLKHNMERFNNWKTSLKMQ